MMKRLYLFLFYLLLSLQLTARPKLVATINILADMASKVAGDAMEVRSLLPSGTDPHTYEPRPMDAALLAEADVIVTNGLHLEGWLDKLIQSAGGKARILVASKMVEPIRA